MIRRLATGLLLLPLLIVIGCRSDVPEGVIAQVGVNSVSLEQFDSLKAAHEAAGRAPDEGKQPDAYESFERGLVEYLVNLEVVRQKAPRFGITVTEREVRDELEKIRQMFRGDEDKFEAALEKRGMTLEHLTQSIKESLLLERVKAAVTGDVAVSEEDAEAYYEAHKSQYVEQESRDVRHILISPYKTSADGVVSTTATEAEWEAARVKAEKVRSEIRNGADFVTQVGKYSDDVATSESGGDLGAVTRGMLVPAFEETVFSLQTGELSQPVRTQYGYHLIQVTDITPGQQLSYEQVMEEIKSELLEQRQEQTWELWVAQTRADLGVTYQSGYGPGSVKGTSADRSTPRTTGE